MAEAVHPIRVLAISGSLRAQSSNTEVLRAAASLAPRGMKITLFAGLDELPHFNPDLDGEGTAPPPAVADLRLRVAEADALLISSPEYAHGVPGALKNALDWLVSSSEVLYKPVALLNAAPRSWRAHASLADTLRTMCMTVLASASIAVPLNDHSPNAEALRQDPDFFVAVRAALTALSAAARESRDTRDIRQERRTEAPT